MHVRQRGPTARAHPPVGGGPVARGRPKMAATCRPVGAAVGGCELGHRWTGAVRSADMVARVGAGQRRSRCRDSQVLLVRRLKGGRRTAVGASRARSAWCGRLPGGCPHHGAHVGRRGVFDQAGRPATEHDDDRVRPDVGARADAVLPVVDAQVGAVVQSCWRTSGEPARTGEASGGASVRCESVSDAAWTTVAALTKGRSKVAGSTRFPSRLV